MVMVSLHNNRDPKSEDITAKASLLASICPAPQPLLLPAWASESLLHPLAVNTPESHTNLPLAHLLESRIYYL